jgi:lysophospholipase L1-like esterase
MVIPHATPIAPVPSAWSDRQRLAWLLALGPLLWLQGRYVRLRTPRLPEPPGARSGVHGSGPALHVLIAGDSAAAGVGAHSQEEALSGQLVQHLARRHTVHWQLHALTGEESPGLLRRLRELPAQPFDVVVLSMGVNDVTALRAPRRWLELQHSIAALVGERFRPRLLVHCAVPPMHVFSALPQPLRWFMGRWAQAFNAQLRAALHQHPWRVHHMLPAQEREAVAGESLASDGFHPGPHAYAQWGQALAQQVLAKTQDRPHPMQEMP